MDEQKKYENHESDWENEGGAVTVHHFKEKASKNGGEPNSLEENDNQPLDLEEFGDPPGGEA